MCYVLDRERGSITTWSLSAGAVLLEIRPRASSDRSEVILNKLNHRSTNTGLGSTTSAPRGGDIEDKEREVRAGRSQGSRPSGHSRTKEEAR